MDAKKQDLLSKIPKILGLDEAHQEILQNLVISTEGAGFKDVSKQINQIFLAQKEVILEVHQNGGDFSKLISKAQKKVYKKSIVRRESEQKESESGEMDSLLGELESCERGD